MRREARREDMDYGTRTEGTEVEGKHERTPGSAYSRHLFFWGGAGLPKLTIPPTAAKLRSLSLFWPGQRITNISRKLHFNGQ